MITLETFILTNNNKFLDFDNKYGAQCVDETRFFWQEVLGIKQPKGVAGAKEFWTNYETDPNLYNNFDKIPNTPEFVPQSGDTMIWKHGEFGHIATVATDKNDTSYFTAFSQNDPTGSPCKLVRYSYSNCYGVLRPKKGNMPDETTPVKKSDWNRILKASQLGDRLINGLGKSGNIADISENDLNEIIDRTKRMLEERDSARSDASEKQRIIDTYPEQLKAAEQKGYEEGYQKGKSELPPVPAPVDEPPAEMTLGDGSAWVRTGIQWREGKIVGVYAARK